MRPRRAQRGALSLLGGFIVAGALLLPASIIPSIGATARDAVASAALERAELTTLGDAGALAAAIEAVGGVVEVQSGQRVQAILPPGTAAGLQAAGLAHIEPPALMMPLQTGGLGSAATIIGAQRWQDAGFTGHGVKVAILDAGFAGYQASLGGALPSTVVERSFRADGRIEAGTDHGTRAARVVHQIAPSARLYLVNFSTVTELSAAVDYLVSEGIDIVSFSLGFIHAGPGDGTGPVNASISKGIAAGQLWSISAGNWAQQHWNGAFRDTDRDTIHEFSPGVQLNGRDYRAGDLIIISLRWDDPWGQACSDYDLELFGPAGSLVRAARGIQDCADDPVETLQVLATASGHYSVRIVGASIQRSHELSLLMLGSPDRSEALDLFVREGSLAQPADTAGAVAVGALVGTSSLRVASYSSRGPTTDGRAKPEVVSPTNETATPAEFTFAGTSAAAPHVAGMAALLAEGFPDLGGQGLLSQIVGRSVELSVTASGGRGAAYLASLGSVEGTGAQLPGGAGSAVLDGSVPAGGGLALFSYRGPDGYPARFVHLLLDGITPRGLYRLDPVTREWRIFVPGAPSFVNTLVQFDNGQVLVARF